MRELIPGGSWTWAAKTPRPTPEGQGRPRSRINLLARVESALFLFYMQIKYLNNLTANIFWFLTPCPGQKQAVFPADPLASFATLRLDYFDFTEAREAYELLG